MQLMVLKTGCYICEKGTPKSKAWIVSPKPERVHSFGFRNKDRKLNKDVWPGRGGEGGEETNLWPSAILTSSLQSISSV